MIVRNHLSVAGAPPLRRLVFATDLRAEAPDRFAVAFGIALRARAELVVLHVAEPEGEADWRALPTVRDLLARWHRLPDDATVEDFERLGVHVRPLDRASADGLRHALSREIAALAPDLVLLGTAARKGLDRLLHGSVAEDVARDLHGSTLFFPESARPIVDPASGWPQLDRVVVPVTTDLPHEPVLAEVARLVGALRPGRVRLELVHADRAAVVEEIVAAAVEREADLVAMGTRGPDRDVDAVRGTRTEQVIRRSPCPVLAVRV